MGDKIKISVLETNSSEELEGPAERSLTADIVELTPAANTYTDVDEWIRNRPAEIIAGIVPPLLLVHNATMNNNQLVGYTNLVNNPVVLGISCKLVRITVSTGTTNSDFALDFFGTESDAGDNNGFFRATVVNALPNFFVVTGSPTFNAGDKMGIYYRDQGDNANDLALALYFEAVL